MEERYWQQFLTTGKVEDYLSYKEKDSGNRQVGRVRNLGVRKRGSDRSDGNGTVEYPRRRV